MKACRSDFMKHCLSLDDKSLYQKSQTQNSMQTKRDNFEI